MILLRSFPPRCPEVPDCGSTEVNSRCRCSGMWGPYDLVIVDIVQVTHLFSIYVYIYSMSQYLRLYLLTTHPSHDRCTNTS